MLMIQTLQPPRSGSSASARTLSLPMLRCSQPYVREGSHSPTTPRLARGLDEYGFGPAGLYGRDGDNSLRQSRPSSQISPRSALHAPRYTPYPSPHGVHEPHAAFASRFPEYGKHLGPEPAMHPALIRGRLQRAQLDEQWREAMPQWARLSKAAIFGRVSLLSHIKAAFLLETSASEQTAIEAIIVREAQPGRKSLRVLAGDLARATLALDDADNAYPAHRLASELVARLADAADTEPDDREMPPAKRRHISAELSEPIADTIRHAYSDAQAQISSELRGLERLLLFTAIVLPQPLGD